MTATHPPRLLRSELARSASSPLFGAFAGRDARQLARFGAIGIVSTAAYVGLFAALRNFSPAAAANAIALVVTAVGNTAANRRLTFEVRGRDGLALHHAAGVLALVAALGITSASLGILQALAPHHGRLTEIAVLVAANAAATVVRFALLRIAIAGAASARASVPAPAFANPSAPQRTRG